MCDICDDMHRREDSECDGGPDCICHKAEASCQPSITTTLPDAPWIPPNTFDPLIGSGGTGGTTVPEDDPNYQLLVDTHDAMSPGRMYYVVGVTNDNTMRLVLACAYENNVSKPHLEALAESCGYKQLLVLADGKQIARYEYLPKFTRAPLIAR